MQQVFRCFFYSLTFVSFVLVSCAQSKPEIRATSVKMLRVQELNEQFSERLSLFVLFSDEDGDQDFSGIRLLHNASGMEWVLEKENTIVRLRGNDRWIGSSDIAPAGNTLFPEGEYTIIASDLSGNEAVKPILLNRPDFPKLAPVSFSLDGDLWTLERNPDAGEFTENFLFLHNTEPWLVHTWKMPSVQKKSVGDLETFRRDAREAVTIQCYSENKSGTAGVLLRPVEME